MKLFIDPNLALEQQKAKASEYLSQFDTEEGRSKVNKWMWELFNSTVVHEVFPPYEYVFQLPEYNQGGPLASDVLPVDRPDRSLNELVDHFKRVIRWPFCIEAYSLEPDDSPFKPIRARVTAIADCEKALTFKKKKFYPQEHAGKGPIVGGMCTGAARMGYFIIKLVSYNLMNVAEAKQLLSFYMAVVVSQRFNSIHEVTRTLDIVKGETKCSWLEELADDESKAEPAEDDGSVEEMSLPTEEVRRIVAGYKKSGFFKAPEIVALEQSLKTEKATYTRSDLLHIIESCQSKVPLLRSSSQETVAERRGALVTPWQYRFFPKTSKATQVFADLGIALYKTKGFKNI